MTRLEVRNIPESLLRRDLEQEFAGRDAGHGLVSGDGWEVRFTTGEPVTLGLTVVPVLFMDVSGPREAEAAAFLRGKATRGGG